MSPDAARTLADLIGDDLGRLDSELAKLALSSDTGKIDGGNITTNVAFQREQEMKDMTIELASGKAAAALTRWRQLLQLDPSTEFKAVTWLGMWLEDVRAYLTAKRSGREREFIGKVGWKYKGDRLREFTDTASKLGQRGLSRAIHLLAEVDHHSKSGRGDASENVERFILSISK